MILVQSQYCPQNHPCPTMRVCPTGALQQSGFDAPTVDAESCIECGRCVASCRVFKEVADAAEGLNAGVRNGSTVTGHGKVLESLKRRMGV